MTIYSTNILAGPLMLAVWAMDAYLLIVMLRMVLGQVSTMRTTTFYGALRQLTDGLPRVMGRWLSRVRQDVNPPWLPWVAVILGILTGRHLLVWIVALSS